MTELDHETALATLDREFGAGWLYRRLESGGQTFEKRHNQHVLVVGFAPVEEKVMVTFKRELPSSVGRFKVEEHLRGLAVVVPGATVDSLVEAVRVLLGVAKDSLAALETLVAP